VNFINSIRSNKNSKKTPFVLLHGAWYTSKCWTKVKKRLEDKGYSVYTPDFPYYDLSTSKEITRKGFISSTLVPLLNSIEQESKQKPIIVGHSLAGTIIAETAELHPEKIKALVFLAGFMLPNGTSVSDLRKHRNQAKALQKIGAIIHPNRVYGRFDVARLDESTVLDRFCPDCSKQDQDEFLKTINWNMPQEPIRTKVELGSSYERVPKFYIKTLKDRSISIDEQEFMIDKTPCKKVFAIDSGHSPFFNKPDDIVDYLQQITFYAVHHSKELNTKNIVLNKKTKPVSIFNTLHYTR
jgi:pimeloyl-ACP methyl ester carboxylesterase